MRLLEFDKDNIADGYYDASKDKFNARHIDDTRKPVLTLSALNRLKKMRALKRWEKLKKQSVYDLMYSPPDSGGELMNPGF